MEFVYVYRNIRRYLCLLIFLRRCVCGRRRRIAVLRLMLLRQKLRDDRLDFGGFRLLFGGLLGFLANLLLRRLTKAKEKSA